MKRWLAFLLTACMLCTSIAFAETAQTDYMKKWTDETNYILDTFFDHFEQTGESEKVAPYDPPITITFVNQYSVAAEERMAKFNERYGETFESNRWSYLIDELLGVKMEYQWWAHSGDDYTQKLRLNMAAGDLPDIFTVHSQMDIIQLAEAGMIRGVSDLLDEYAIDSHMSILLSDNGLGFNKVKVDGEIYGIPMRASDTDPYSYLWLRQDWMETLGLDAPETIEDLYAIIRAFAAADFDGNGVDDTIGLTVNKDLLYSSRGFFNAFDSHPQYWVEVDGELVYGAIQEQTKTALRELAMLYAEGLLDPEFITKTESVTYENVLNSKAGVVYAGHWFGHTLGTMHNLDPDARWFSVKLPSATGNAVRSVISPNIDKFICINANFEHPEAALKIAALWNYCFYNANDTSWFNYEENDSRNYVPIGSGVPANDNLLVYQDLQRVLSGQMEASDLTGKAVAYYANLNHETMGYEWHMMFGAGDTPLKVLEEAYNDGLLFYDGFQGVQNEFMQERWNSLLDEFTTTVTKIVTGEVDVDAGFDQWLKTWNGLGGNEITEYVNEWYQSVQ